MPKYRGSGNSCLMSENNQFVLWSKEAVNIGDASQAWELRRVKGLFYPWGISYQLKFSADPGDFQVDIQHSDTDNEDYFVTVNSMTSGLNAAFCMRLELPTCYTRYVRAKIVKLDNPVNVELKITR